MKVDVGGTADETDEFSNSSVAVVLIGASGETTTCDDFLLLDKLNLEIKADNLYSSCSDHLESASKGCLCKLICPHSLRYE